MIRASTNNKRRMFTKIPASDAELGLVPAGLLPLTWNDRQQAILCDVGLSSDRSDSSDTNNDDDGSNNTQCLDR